MEQTFKKITHYSFLFLLYSLFYNCNSPEKKTEKKITQKTIKLNENKFNISGIANIATDSIFLLDKNKILIQKVALKNNKFSFSGTVKKPTISFLKAKGLEHLFILENTQYNVLIDKFSIKIIGGNINETLLTFLEKKQEFNTKKALKYTAYKNKKHSLKKYLELLDNIQKEENNYQLNFIIENKNNLLALYVLNTYNLSSNSLKYLLKKLPKTTNNKLTTYTTSLLKKKTVIEAKEKIKQRPKAIDFSGINLNGTKTTLTQVKRGKKAVLIDFWASWCGPCRAVSPTVRRLYYTYKNKGFDIITVSQDRSINDWEVGVYDDGMQDWNHIYDANNYIASSYGVRALPFMVLLDDKGRIVQKNISLTAIEAYLKKNLK